MNKRYSWVWRKHGLVYRALQLFSVGCLIIAAFCTVEWGVWQATTQAAEARDVWEMSSFGLDAGLTIAPAQEYDSGYAEVWVYPWNGDDYLFTLRVNGASPLKNEEAAPEREVPRPAPVREGWKVWEV